jgi:hypothetical protein
MKKCVEMCCKAGQQYSVQTFDQQLYAIAQQIKWSRPLEFQNHIIRLGGADSTPYHALSHLLANFEAMVVWLIYPLIQVYTLHAQ